MSHVNFITSDALKFTENTGLEFMVRSKKLFANSLSDYASIVDDESLKISYNFYFLNYDESIRQDLTPYFLEDGQLTVNYENGMRRKLNVSILNEENWVPSPVFGFLWKGSKFKLEICIKTTSAECVCPAGVFILNEFEMPHEHSQNKITLDLVDKFGGLDGTVGGKIIDAIHIPNGSNIRDAILSLLYGERVEGERFEPKTVLFPLKYYHSTTPYTITKSADSNSSIGDIIKELVKIINLEVFYDVYGRMCFAEMDENIITNTQPSVWGFNDNDCNYESPSLRVNMQSVTNIVSVQGANINGSIVDITVKNTNPKSLTNVSIFEPTICRIVDENIANIELAQTRAKYELFKRSLMPLSMTFNTIVIPMLNAGDIITIDDSYYKFKRTRFLIHSISIPITQTPKMQLSIANLEEVAFDGR